MRKLPFILGPLLILAGGWLVLMILAFSTLIDPDLQGWAWWRVLLRGVFLNDPAWLLGGLGLIVLGFRVAASGGRPARPIVGKDELA
jgi:hypothetical protein